MEELEEPLEQNGRKWKEPLRATWLKFWLKHGFQSTELPGFNPGPQWSPEWEDRL